MVDSFINGFLKIIINRALKMKRKFHFSFCIFNNYMLIFHSSSQLFNFSVKFMLIRTSNKINDKT